MADNTSGTWDLIVSPWHLDEHIPDFPVPVGTAAVIGPPLPDGAVPGRVNVLHQAVADAVAGAARPLLLSGDCPAALGVTAALQRRYREIAVVWLDAHGDFNTPAITSSGYLGGMPVAMLTGRAPELFARTSWRHRWPAPGSPGRSAGRSRARRSPGWPARSAPGSPGRQETRRAPPAQPDRPGTGVQRNKGSSVGERAPVSRVPRPPAFPLVARLRLTRSVTDA